MPGAPAYPSYLTHPASELRAISAALAAAEEQVSSERPLSETTTETQPAPDDTTLAEIILALAQAERIGDDENQPLRCIPPAPASLAWMADQSVQAAAVRLTTPPEEAVALPTPPITPPPATRRRPLVPAPVPGEAFQQLSLFG